MNPLNHGGTENTEDRGQRTDKSATRNTQHAIQKLHALYVSETGHAITLDPARERDWFEWLKRIDPATDNPETALSFLIAHLRRAIREQKRQPGCLKFRNLIGQPDYFEEDLAEARAQARGEKKRTEDRGQRTETLRATGRLDGKAKHDSPEPPARTAAQILAADAAFAEFRKMKHEL